MSQKRTDDPIRTNVTLSRKIWAALDEYAFLHRMNKSSCIEIALEALLQERIAWTDQNIKPKAYIPKRIHVDNSKGLQRRKNVR